MKEIIKKTLYSFCIMILCLMCSFNRFPLYALADESENVYGRMKPQGDIYKTMLNTKSEQEETPEIPIDTTIKYYLDDKEISIDDLKGKSGKLKIEINFINKEKHDVMISGKTVTMYTPYIVGTSIIINNNKFANTTISSGKIIDNGTDSVVVGIAMPGMQESLDLSDTDIEIPENITIESDVTDFELGNIYIYIESNIFGEDSLDFLDEFESMYDDARELKNASKQLVDGSSSLKTGASTYASKMGEFNSGLSKYTSGVSSVNENYSKINSGISTINENTKKIADGSSSLNSGIQELKSTLSTLVSGIVQIKQGTDGIYNGLTQMIAGVDGSIANIQNSGMDTSGLTALATATETSIGTLSATKASLASTKSNLETLASNMPDSFDTVETSTNELGETIYTPSQIPNEHKAQIIEQINALGSQISAIDGQIDGLKQNVAQERGAYSTALQTVGQKSVEMVNGLSSLKTNLQTLQGVSLQVKNGIDAMAGSSPELQAGLDKLESGSNALATGAQELSNGTATLSSGSETLKSGIEQLNANSSTITSAGQQLQDGANQISSGANQLADGMKEFDSEGINTIYDLINGDLSTAQERVEKLMDLAKNNGDTTYKYIIKVDSIKK